MDVQLQRSETSEIFTTRSKAGSVLDTSLFGFFSAILRGPVHLKYFAMPPIPPRLRLNPDVCCVTYYPLSSVVNAPDGA